MTYSPDYYTARIAEVKLESETKAQTLLARARHGEITYTEAWYSLPGPEPIVEARGYYPETHYIVQYPFLEAGDAASLKSHAEREFHEAVKVQTAILTAIPQGHEQTAQELKTAMETSRRVFDGETVGHAQRKSRVEELRATLAACEAAYEAGLQRFEAAKQKKDSAEAAHVDYTSKASALMQVATEDAKAPLMQLDRHRDANVARQQEEADAGTKLWKGKEGAVFDQQGLLAQTRVERQRQAQITARIEEEARRRLRVDAEFESAVAARLQQIRNQ